MSTIRLGRTTRLGDALGSFDKQTFETAAEVKERTRKNCADPLKDQKSRAWIDVRVSLALKCHAECKKKHQRYREIFQIVCHAYPRESCLRGQPYLE